MVPDTAPRRFRAAWKPTLLRQGLRLALALLALGFFSPAQEAAAAQADDKIVVIADIHGALPAFRRLLEGLDLVDAGLHWSGGRAQLVILGDVLDRGPQSRQALDLTMALEGEAAAAGGALHLLLGNHEIMNLVGDLRYVSREDFASYREEEAPAVRQQAFLRFSAGQRTEDPAALQAAFDQRFPPGFFGHRSAFARDGRYGAWLLDKPLLLVLGHSAFLHAGLSEDLLGLPPAELNQRARATLRRYLTLRQELEQAGVLPVESDFQEHDDLLEQALADAEDDEDEALPPALLAAAAELLGLWQDELFDSPSPVWYRGMVGCSPALEYGRVQRALAGLGVERLALGHTPTDDHLVQQRFDGRLLFADTGMLQSRFGGQPAALLIEGDAVRVYYADADAYAPPVEQPRRVGPRPPGFPDLSDEELESMLLQARVLSEGEEEDGRRQVTLEYAGQTFPAQFVRAGRGRNLPDVAAYRLDRLLALELVPVSVPRQIAGETGALGLAADDWPSEEARAAGTALEPWCPLEDQYALMYAFDKLIHHEGRTPGQMRYDPQRGKLVLVGNHESLGSQRRLPAYLRAAPLLLPPLLAERLAALSESRLEEALGDVLDERRRSALLRRRDALLDEAGG